MRAATIDVSTDADRRRFQRYQEAAEFANGRQGNHRPAPGESQLIFNYAAALIRKSASYLFPAPVTFAVQDESSRTESAAQAEQWLNTWCASNGMHQLDLSLATEASILGDIIVKITWHNHQPRVVPVHPASVTALTAPDNPRSITQIAHHYTCTTDQLQHLFPDLTAPIATPINRQVRITEIWTTETWQVEINGTTALTRNNPYGWIPYVIAANNPPAWELWGRSDLDPLQDVCREINRRATVLSRVLELSGAPIAVFENVDGSEGIAVGPGAKWELPEGARAYLLDLLQGGGVHLHIEYMDMLFRVLHDLSETPRTAFGDSGRNLSGAALEVEIQPLVQKVRRQRRMWDQFFRERNYRMLDLESRFGKTEIGTIRETRTIWPPVLPGDEETLVRTTVSKVTNRLQSRRSAIAALGHEQPEAELELIRTEQHQSMQPAP